MADVNLTILINTLNANTPIKRQRWSGWRLAGRSRPFFSSQTLWGDSLLFPSVVELREVWRDVAQWPQTSLVSQGGAGMGAGGGSACSWRSHVPFPCLHVVWSALWLLTSACKRRIHWPGLDVLKTLHLPGGNANRLCRLGGVTWLSSAASFASHLLSLRIDGVWTSLVGSG